MSNLNCKLGELAIIVKAYNLENIGKVVKIIRSKGFTTWPDIQGLVYAWLVETVVEGVKIKYSVGDTEYSYRASGFLPDTGLRPLLKNKGNVTQEETHETENLRELEACDV